MKPDTPARADDVERAHLDDPADTTWIIYRVTPSTDLLPVAQRFWIPVWSVPPGLESPQQVLQHPVALIVVSGDYARFYGVVAGLSTTTLSGDGWAAGVMLTPAAGWLLAGRPMTELTDRHVDVAEVMGDDAGARLTARVRAAMHTDPRSPRAHAAAVAAFEDVLRPLLPVDEEGLLVNRVVELVMGDAALVRVDELAARVGLTPRSLERLTRRRLGLTPKWLVQRRRLHEAAELLRRGGTALTDVAAALGYADQAHFTRDFARVTGATPGAFAARYAAGPPASVRPGEKRPEPPPGTA